MNITIDKNSKDPVYEQIRSQIVQLIKDGLLPAGHKLPSVRDLAKKLGVSVKTVRTAYDELGAESIIETRHGSGTFVTNHPAVATRENLRTREEMATRLAELPAMRWEPFQFRSEFFALPRSKVHHKNTISFIQASPDPCLFPFERIKQVATNMLWYPKEFFFDRGHAQGYQPLVEYLEKEMALAGIPMAEGENDIIITGGFHRALSLILDLIIKPGHKIAIEEPTYTGILNLLITKHIDYVPIPVDEDGMDTDYLASVLNQGEVKAIITIPTYHNPTGITMSQDRREHLLKLAAKHRVPIIEDDWGRHLRFEGAAPPPLKAIDPGGYVIQIGTFSKCFLPGMRIGWITCPAPLSVSLYRSKIGADAGDSFFLQVLLHEFILKGHFAKHIRRTVKEYKKRRNAMCKALDTYLPDGCTYRKPEGGLSIWVKLPRGFKCNPLLSLARKEGVEFSPAALFMPDRNDAEGLRLSFARTDVQAIETGVEILGKTIRDCINNPGLLESGALDYKDLFK